MTVINMNTPNYKKQFNPELFLQNAIPLDKKQKQAIKQQIGIMYNGLVLANWPGVKLGTAKYKALEQLESFVKTLMSNSKTNGAEFAHAATGNNNAVVNEVARVVSVLKKKVAEQIMTSKSSEQMLSPKLAQKYKMHGEQLASVSMRELRKMANGDKQRVQTNEKQIQNFQQSQQILLWRIMAERAKAA